MPFRLVVPARARDREERMMDRDAFSTTLNGLSFAIQDMDTNINIGSARDIRINVPLDGVINADMNILLDEIRYEDDPVARSRRNIDEIIAEATQEMRAEIEREVESRVVGRSQYSNASVNIGGNEYDVQDVEIHTEVVPNPSVTVPPGLETIVESQRQMSRQIDELRPFATLVPNEVVQDAERTRIREVAERINRQHFQPEPENVAVVDDTEAPAQRTPISVAFCSSCNKFSFSNTEEHECACNGRMRPYTLTPEFDDDE